MEKVASTNDKYIFTEEYDKFLDEMEKAHDNFVEPESISDFLNFVTAHKSSLLRILPNGFEGLDLRCRWKVEAEEIPGVTRVSFLPIIEYWDPTEMPLVALAEDATESEKDKRRKEDQRRKKNMQKSKKHAERVLCLFDLQAEAKIRVTSEINSLRVRIEKIDLEISRIESKIEKINQSGGVTNKSYEIREEEKKKKREEVEKNKLFIRKNRFEEAIEEDFFGEDILSLLGLHQKRIQGIIDDRELKVVIDLLEDIEESRDIEVDKIAERELLWHEKIRSLKYINRYAIAAVLGGGLTYLSVTLEPEKRYGKDDFTVEYEQLSPQEQLEKIYSDYDWAKNNDTRLVGDYLKQYLKWKRVQEKKILYDLDEQIQELDAGVLEYSKTLYNEVKMATREIMYKQGLIVTGSMIGVLDERDIIEKIRKDVVKLRSFDNEDLMFFPKAAGLNNEDDINVTMSFLNNPSEHDPLETAKKEFEDIYIQFTELENIGAEQERMGNGKFKISNIAELILGYLIEYNQWKVKNKHLLNKLKGDISFNSKIVKMDNKIVVYSKEAKAGLEKTVMDILMRYGMMKGASSNFIHGPSYSPEAMKMIGLVYRFYNKINILLTATGIPTKWATMTEDLMTNYRRVSSNN